jgi:2'-5' RNA ligase
MFWQVVHYYVSCLMDPSLFFLAVLPDERVSAFSTELKNTLCQRFGVCHALKSPPHITLVMPFRAGEEDLALLTSRLRSISVQHHPLHLQFQGYGHFGDQVVFMQVMPSGPLTVLRDALLQTLPEAIARQVITRNPHFHPHLTLAHRDLTPDRFPEVWSYVSSIPCQHESRIDAVCLLVHEQKRWRVRERFPFAAFINPGD